MYPWTADTPNRQPPSAPHQHPHKSWSDGNSTALPHPSRAQGAFGTRSASFTSSRSPNLPSRQDFPVPVPAPPPVPPLPPSLVPGFQRPSLVHSHDNLFFTNSPQSLQPSIQRQQPPFASPSPPNTSATTPATHWASESSPISRPDTAPSLPPRPTYPNDHVFPNDFYPQETETPVSYGPVQHYFTSPFPHPAVPRRPMTAHDVRLSDSSPAPALPPKPFANLVVSTTVPDTLLPPIPPKVPPLSRSSFNSESTKVDLSSPLLAPDELSDVTPGHSRTKSAEDIERAMELSREEYKLSDTLPVTEDHDLQRVLTESLAESDPHLESDMHRGAQHSDTQPNRTPSPGPEPSSAAAAMAAEAADREAAATARQLQRERDERAALRLLRETEQERFVEDQREREQRERDSKAAIRMLMQQEEERREREKRVFEQRDEEMARRQAQEEQQALRDTQQAQKERDEEMERESKAAIRMLVQQEEERREREKRELEQRDAEMAQQQAEQQRVQREAQQAQERRDEEMARQQAELEERARREEQQAQEQRDAEMARNLAVASNAGPSHSLAYTPVIPGPRIDSLLGPSHPLTSTPVIPGPRIDSLARPVPPRGKLVALNADGQSSPAPPQYDEVVTSQPTPLPEKRRRPRQTQASSQSSPLPSETSHPLRPRATSAVAVPPHRPEFVRSSTVAAQSNKQNRPETGKGTNIELHGPPPGSSTAAAPPANPPVRQRQTHPNHTAGPPQPNGVPNSQGDRGETELLKGVSFGFGLPDTKLESVRLSELPSCQPLPEVISLHPAPAPPFHIVALSWRHLMRLLAQFETRIEASVGAIAQSKDDSVLRVVIQFVKLPYTENEWRTILHIAIDQPVPPNASQAWRYKNGDTTVLPYSFALGGTPPNFHMSALSQFYTVPVSLATPLPILPLALPNLALYLQSAMRDSRNRKVQSDTTNGMRRLALLLGTCYPEEVVNAESEERASGRGVGKLLKRVVGGKKRQDTQGNEEVYDMVTPFRIDKYTTVA